MSKAKVVRYMFWPHGAKWLDGVGQSGAGEMEINNFGDYVLYSQHESALAELRNERDSFAKHCELLTHKVITCGVAARHPDAGLSKRGAYADKWDSPQAQDVRDLRDAKDAAEEKLTALLTGLEALAGEWEKLAGWESSFQNTMLREHASRIRTLASAGLEGKSERGQFSKCDNCGSGPWNTGWDPESRQRKSKKFYCPNCTGAT